MDQLISMGYVNPDEVDLNEQPLMDESRARISRNVNLKPWHLQDHREVRRRWWQLLDATIQRLIVDSNRSPLDEVL